MEGDLLRLIRDQGHVSFAELRRHFPAETGDVSMAMPGYENIIIWWGMSENLARTVADLIQRKEVHVHPASPLTYAVDGVITSMPLAESLSPYKKPHWFPVTLHHTPYVEKR